MNPHVFAPCFEREPNFDILLESSYYKVLYTVNTDNIFLVITSLHLQSYFKNPNPVQQPRATLTTANTYL